MVSCELLNNSSLRQLQLALNPLLWHTIVYYSKLQNIIVCNKMPYYTTEGFRVEVGVEAGAE